MSERSKAEQRMIRRFQKRGGKGFRILRSAEMPLKHYERPPTPPSAPESEGETSDLSTTVTT